MLLSCICISRFYIHTVDWLLLSNSCLRDYTTYTHTTHSEARWIKGRLCALIALTCWHFLSSLGENRGIRAHTHTYTHAESTYTCFWMLWYSGRHTFKSISTRTQTESPNNSWDSLTFILQWCFNVCEHFRIVYFWINPKTR